MSGPKNDILTLQRFKFFLLRVALAYRLCIEIRKMLSGKWFEFISITHPTLFFLNFKLHLSFFLLEMIFLTSSGCGSRCEGFIQYLKDF